MMWGKMGPGRIRAERGAMNCAKSLETKERAAGERKGRRFSRAARTGRLQQVAQLNPGAGTEPCGRQGGFGATQDSCFRSQGTGPGSL